MKTYVTGQQIGLLGGPLYTTYKVLGCIHLARENEGKAVYWLETNDADFNEINHIDYIDAGGGLRTLTWDIQTGGLSTGLVEIDLSLVELFESFFSSMRQTDFTPVLRELVLDCYKPGHTLGKASICLARELFGDYKPEFFDPSGNEFRVFSRPILQREAERTAEGSQCNLFCMIGNRREALFKTAGGFRLRNGSSVDISGLDLVPNVKTRNLCQDAFFSTHTYVAGPGEVKYIDELDEIYQFHGVKKALVQPRMSVTLVEPRTRRLLKKTGVSFQEVMELEKAGMVKKVLKGLSGFDYKEILNRANASTGSYLKTLEEMGLETRELRKLLVNQVKSVCGRKRTLEKEKHNKVIESLNFLSDNLKPLDKKQDRVFNIFYYMNLFGGREFIHWIYNNYHTQAEILEIEHV